MQATEGKLGRVFVLKLEDGDVIPACIEAFAREKEIDVAQVLFIGGIGGGNIVVGPRTSSYDPIDPIVLPVEGAHEVIGVGVIAKGPDDQAMLHIHGALGRAGKTTTGCLRPGVNTWLVGEVIITEILGTSSKRVYDEKSCYALLKP
ncbi:MAG: DNA-binding protein [Bacillota bacterium]|nr:DNA-binding protein [Bacillota bacterium]